MTLVLHRALVQKQHFVILNPTIFVDFRQIQLVFSIGHGIKVQQTLMELDHLMTT